MKRLLIPYASSNFDFSERNITERAGEPLLPWPLPIRQSHGHGAFCVSQIYLNSEEVGFGGPWPTGQCRLVEPAYWV